MAWFDGRPRIRLTGYRCAADVDEVFSRDLVDVAYVIETGQDAIFIVADNPAWPADAADQESGCARSSTKL